MSIEVGSIVYLKTTDEPIFILSVSEKGLERATIAADYMLDKAKFSGTTIFGRRPILTEHGIQHVVEEFLIEEVETRQDKEQRAFNEMQSTYAQLKASGGANLAPISEHKN